MTTKPKARKFRIRRSGPDAMAPRPHNTAAAPDKPAQDAPREVPRPGPAAAPQPEPARSGQVASARETAVDARIDAIRREGLTGRQLRMARRVAQKHGLAPTSDFDAVRLLREAGIDPFQRSTMLELVVPEGEHGTGEGGVQPMNGLQMATAKVPADRVQLPQTMPAGETLPSTEIAPAERRASEIRNIQRDIARRRRRKLALLLTRLSFFVLLPTVICGWYFYTIATPMYATKSEFLVMQADSQGGSGLGGLLSGTQFATNQDSIATQSYLQSRDAMQRLNTDMAFKAHFSQQFIDPVQRLSDGASDEAAYKLFKKNVKIGYDPTEGVIRMEVVAADPAVSADFSHHLIDYAEERVDQLSREKREDQMKDARQSLETAKLERREAQAALVALQESTILDPEGEIASIRSLIGTLEAQLVEKKLELNGQLTNTRPNRARVDSLRTEITLIQDELAQQNSRLTDATEGENSLAQKASEIQMAQADLATADLFLQSALQNMKQTELEANRQVRYLTTSVEPVAPDAPTYPRKFENTILAFLIFSGIYLMVSLTASILREQVSS
ncbi:capsular polysaccharide transport system permease protein [Lutimaribacter pacificus]|uniref:Capsular polysaccharide transport system permease protein n=1 Tax=Lutimaribacter pacificus TaxID=391948 RepID=A0A1H0I996_9RHOB|nr:capsule biosynthesis protein [Lutimaribacter pacificus]SDO27972.1 capsular polysaccharide transport system permease protein [Lutimaribacter pacificus]SHK24514.1 capsular polysaccharide transport system permease protein [Lutimaribacter pacificus]